MFNFFTHKIQKKNDNGTRLNGKFQQISKKLKINTKKC